MSIFYQPMSGSNDIPNCLTPNSNLEDQFGLIKQQLILTNNNNSSSTSSITSNTSGTSSPGGAQPLSPPLSPYQRSASLHLIKQPLPILPKLNENNKSYLQNSNSEFKLENFNDYKLTVEIKSVDKNYYNKQLDFLNRYSTLSNSERSSAAAASNATSLPPRKYKKRLNYDSNDEITPSDIERVRTRRVAKTSNKDLTTDDETFTSLPSTPPPKKKKRTTTSSPSIPILTLQQQLIDESIPDYSPDISTLPPKNAKCLKIEWKGQPMDLSNDPNLDKLKHPAEVMLASILRLPVAVYLDSKRRFFYEKVNRIRSGKTFRRTDAQKACRIDVNKASRLFAAFEKVGWLNDKLFEKYL